MSDPMPPDEWSTSVQRQEAEPGHAFPPRPDVVEVSGSNLAQPAEGMAEHEGHRPSHAAVRPEPQLLPPEQERAPRWRRPPGQKDDMGEPTGGSR